MKFSFFIYDENDANINYTDNKPLYDEFEKRYQSEKIKLKEREEVPKIEMAMQTNASNYDISEHGVMHR